jgi:hypothetical protein
MRYEGYRGRAGLYRSRLPRDHARSEGSQTLNLPVPFVIQNETLNFKCLKKRLPLAGDMTFLGEKAVEDLS